MDELLRHLVVIFIGAGAVLHLLNRLRVPAVVGLLVAGVLIGPHGLRIVTDASEVGRLADMGIILLMFSIGLDFTRDRLKELFRASGMGVLQMAICITVTASVAILYLDRWAEAIFIGFLVAHTSSTLMLKLFLDRGELRAPQVRLGLGISITQDLSAVPMLLAVPILSRGEWDFGGFGLEVLRAIAALAVAVVLARWIIPLWLHHVVHARSRELFLIFLAVVALGTAWATTAVGLPASLGAFLAGLAIAGSPYSDQTLAEVVPFRDLLVSLFFISIGMLLDVGVMVQYLGIGLAAVVGVVILKFLSGLVPVLVSRYPLRIAVLVGMGMAQIGEFAFVLVHSGREAGLVSEALFQLLVLVAIVSMAINPFLVAAGPRLAALLARVRWLRRLDHAIPQADLDKRPRNHVIIAGYGVNGRGLGRALLERGIDYVAIELSPDRVKGGHARGEPVLFGDSTRLEVLGRAEIEQARLLVVGISDRRATRQTVQLARRHNSSLQIIARTRTVEEIEDLQNLGADVVVAEEAEASLAILSRLLRACDVEQAEILESLDRIRHDAYRTLRLPDG